MKHTYVVVLHVQDKHSSHTVLAVQGICRQLCEMYFLVKSVMKRSIPLSYMYGKYGANIRRWLAEISIKTMNRGKQLGQLCLQLTN